MVLEVVEMEKTALEKAVLFLLKESYYASDGSASNEAQFHMGEVEHEIQSRVAANPSA